MLLKITNCNHSRRLRCFSMKQLLVLGVIAFTFSASAQYKDSLKTFRKHTKTYQKSSDYVFIPSGSYTRGTNDSDLPYANGAYFRNHTMHVDSFFMQKCEVNNRQYLEFVKAQLAIDSVLGKSYLPDTLVWRSPTGFNEPYVEYYFRHPAYSNYPVVGVSYNQAKAYAEWCTEKYNSDEKRVFKKVQFRLPTEEEWEYAFRGNNSYSYLPWGTNSTFDENGKVLANFLIVSQLGIYRYTLSKTFGGRQETQEVIVSSGAAESPRSHEANGTAYSDITAPVNTYKPNSFGLYQMAGNVEEMVEAYYFRDASIYSFSHDTPEKSDQPWGITKGGSWNDPGYYLQYPVRQFYDGPNATSAEIGFRLVMDVLVF